MAEPLSRRRVVAAGGGILAVSALSSACDLFSTNPNSKGADDGSSGKGSPNPQSKEPPSLAARIRAGKLPPLRQRLPETPLVIKPTERIGTYGGEWHTFITNVDGGDVYEDIGYDNLVRWDPQWAKVIPNVAQSWKVEGGGRAYVFHLRKGMRWSDGEPFTVDDITFVYDDVLRVAKLFPVFPDWLSTDGRPATLEKLDDHACRFTFSEPNGFLLQNLATPAGNIFTSLPRHYLKKFHQKYNADVKQLAKKEGYSDWSEMFLAKGGAGLQDLGPWQNKALPTLLAWRVAEPLTGGQRLVAERNPYYWKTDPDGRQLPYLDKVVLEVIKEPETAVLQISQGQFSLPPSEVLTVSNKPVLASNRQKSGYHFIDLVTSKTNNGIIVLNMAHQDPNLRKIFQSKDFRIGLSYAINRKEVIAAVFQRQGEPWQTSPRRESEFFDERLAKQYTAYDLTKANSYLDKAGYSRRDSDRFRLGPDGKRISFTVEIPIGYNPTWVQTAELVKSYWRKVGIDMSVKSLAATLFTKRASANKHDAVMWNGENGLKDAILDPKWYFPSGGGSFFAVPWGTWYTSEGKEGEKPPAAPRRQMQLYDQVKATSDTARQRELFKQILRISQEQFYVIGTALPVGWYCVVKDDFQNVPKSMPEAYLYPNPGPTRPEQFYISGEG